MAWGVIELGTIARSQDITTIKHGEDNKGLAQQTNMAQNMQQEVNESTRQVKQSEDVDWHNQKYDAKDKGKGSYGGDGGKSRNKKQEPDGKCVVKNSKSFDIKI